MAPSVEIDRLAPSVGWGVALKKVLFSALLLLMTSSPGHAEIYQWIDGQGGVHYTDRRPAQPGVPATGIDVAPPPPGTQAQAYVGDAPFGAPGGGRGGGDFADLWPNLTEIQRFEQTFDDFVAAAGSGDLARVLPFVRRLGAGGVDEGFIQRYLTNQVIPFFSQMQRLHNARQINPAANASGAHVGYWIYTYIVDKRARIRPFAAALMGDSGDIFVTNVLVDRCRPGRHPFCP